MADGGAGGWRQAGWVVVTWPDETTAEARRSGSEPLGAHRRRRRDPDALEVVETVLSNQIDDLKPRLARHGYNVRNLAAQFHTKPREIKQFLRGALDQQRTHELNEQTRAAGLPL